VARKRKKQREAEAGFGRETGSEERRRLTPVDIQQKVFRLAFRGYNERDVDEFLDRVTEDLAALHEENKRLREQVAEGGGSAEGIEEARSQAEAIVRQAREHAASLVEEAEARVAAAEAAAAQATPALAGEASGSELPTSFLLRERQFLQQMAGLIQSHARTLKEEARRARAAATEGTGERPAMAEDQPTGAEVSVASSEPAPPATPPEAGAMAAGGIAAAAAVPPSGPEEEEPAEATAPWTPPDEAAQPEAESSPEESDALLSAWESAFTSEDADREDASMPAFPSDPERRKGDDQGEPSLRELFWGEE
jgi:cell division initiation protein